MKKITPAKIVEDYLPYYKERICEYIGKYIEDEYICDDNTVPDAKKWFIDKYFHEAVINLAKMLESGELCVNPKNQKISKKESKNDV